MAAARGGGHGVAEPAREETTIPAQHVSETGGNGGARGASDVSAPPPYVLEAIYGAQENKEAKYSESLNKYVTGEREIFSLSTASNFNILSLCLSLSLSLCVCVYVCVRVRMLERERERKKECLCASQYSIY